MWYEIFLERKNVLTVTLLHQRILLDSAKSIAFIFSAVKFFEKVRCIEYAVLPNDSVSNGNDYGTDANHTCSAFPRYLAFATGLYQSFSIVGRTYA